MNQNENWYWEKGGTQTGREFLTDISDNDDDCTLIFRWNRDMTVAKIEGYFDSKFKSLPILLKKKLGDVIDKNILSLSIELEPYWKWKFGLAITNPFLKKKFKNLDAKCCPPKRGHDDGSEQEECMGPNSLGKVGSSCETISMACGDIQEEHLEDCAMYKRKNQFGFFSGGNYYLVYALADKYGDETPYNKVFSEVYGKGIENLFHGVERV